MDLSVIIVNYNTQEYLRQVLNSLGEKHGREIIVVDNASTDDSLGMLKTEFPQAKILENSQNLGFAKANNQALRIARGKYFLLLNSDTLVHPQALEHLVAGLETGPAAGIAAPQLLNRDGTIQVHGGYLPNLLNLAFWMFFLDDLPWLGKYLHPYHLNDKAFFRKEGKTGWVAGTAMLIKSELIKKVGFLNEDFFMYGEDVEYCLRAAREGYQIILVPQAKITHFGQGSSGGKSAPARIGEYKALLRIFQKYHSPLELALLRPILKAGALLRMLVFGILQGRETYDTYKKAYRLV